MKKTMLSMMLIISTSGAFGQIQTTTSKDCYIVYDYNGKEFLKNQKIKNGSPITVFEDFKDYETFYTIEYKKIKGCIKKDCITINEEVSKLFQIKKDEESAKIEKIEKADSAYIEMTKRHKEALEEEEKARYGKWYGYIKTKQVSIGMPADFIEDAIGPPKQINNSQYSFGTRAQYVYKDMYIYTKNGIIEVIRRTKTY